MMRLRRTALRLAALLAVAAAAGCSAGAGMAVPPADSPAVPAGPRLYVFDGGTILNGGIAVAYLIQHPLGTLMWEAGTLPDSMVQNPPPVRSALLEKFNARASRTLASQLAAIAQPASAITYFAASHYHFDHIANAASFTASTWLVQQVDRDAMFADGPVPFGAEPSFYEPLRTVKTQTLHGDHDVFGDGTVVLMAAPGHTPGHQVLFVKLPRTGPVLLSGDVYHNPSERDAPLDTVPPMDTNKDQSKATRTRLEAFAKEAGAALWIEHDAALFRTQRQAPAYYD